MGEWKECKLGDVLTLQRGHDLPRTKMIDGNIPVAGSNGIIGYHNLSTTKAPGVTIGRSGNLGNAFFYNKDFWAHNTTLYVKDFKDNIEIFVYYFLKTFDFKQFNVGSAVPTLNRNHIHPIDVIIPPLPEQKAIASVLSSLDDKIDLLHLQNKTLEAMAETLFRQWFVEEAKDDWEEGVLNDILSMKGGTTPSTKKSEYWDGEICWTAPRDLSGNQHIYMFDTGRKITEQGLAKISSGLLPVGTILLSSRAPIGYLAITDIQVAINQGYIAILDNKGFSKYFLYLWVKNNIDYIISNANGSTFLEISKSVFKGLEVQKPPADLRNEFDEQAIPIFQKIKTNSIQIRTLEKLRDTLLPKLMSGEVRVKYDKKKEGRHAA
ncbi:restriction endonuclease subunit S [Desulfobacterales bacterium HSG16]|nr:restriction endonuclease subunit S [Desulfobacterales bacterium HSG16]